MKTILINGRRANKIQARKIRRIIPNANVTRVTRRDPTRTGSIRLDWMNDFNRRFAHLKEDIKKSIIDDDCFGIDTSTNLITHKAAGRKRFVFERDPQKIASFMKWLEDQEDAGILQRVHRPGVKVGIEPAWTDTYIDSAYVQGIRRARGEMVRAGISMQGILDESRMGIGAAFNQPIHADAVGVLYMRTFEDLKTVTREMNNQIRRKIADGLRTGITQGMAEGKNPRQIASELVKDIENRVDKVGIYRARMIARTETIRAHHVATIQEYRRADAEMGVRVMAELSATHDDRVCDECLKLEARTTKKPMSLNEIEGLIPVHPNCRCAAIPAEASLKQEQRETPPPPPIEPRIERPRQVGPSEETEPIEPAPENIPPAEPAKEDIERQNELGWSDEDRVKIAEYENWMREINLTDNLDLAGNEDWGMKFDVDQLSGTNEEALARLRRIKSSGDRLMKKYNLKKLVKQDRVYVVQSTSEGNLGTASYYDETQGKVISISGGDEAGEMRADLIRQAKERGVRTVVGIEEKDPMMVDSTFRHELAHRVDEEFEIIEGQKNEIGDMIGSILNDQDQMEWMRKNVSEYAASGDPAELFAELFSYYTSPLYGTKYKALSRDIVKVLEKVLNFMR